MADPFQQQLIDYYLSLDPRLRHPLVGDAQGLPTYLGPSRTVARPMPYVKPRVIAVQPDPPIAPSQGAPRSFQDLVQQYMTMPPSEEKEALRRRLFGDVV